jgi:hypothetical protein
MTQHNTTQMATMITRTPMMAQRTTMTTVAEQSVLYYFAGTTLKG